MTETEKLRVLLAEARELVGFLPTHPAGINAVIQMQKRIGTALAEPPKPECEFCEQSRRDYNRVIEANKVFLRERDEARAEVERAFRRGAEAMREAAARYFDTTPCVTMTVQAAIRALLIPEDK